MCLSLGSIIAANSRRKYFALSTTPAMKPMTEPKTICIWTTA